MRDDFERNKPQLGANLSKEQRLSACSGRAGHEPMSCTQTISHAEVEKMLDTVLVEKKPFLHS